MISKILNTLQRGLAVMLSNTRIVLVGVLVFLMPLLFLWVAQSFLSAANANIETIEAQRVSAFHDTFALLLREHATPSVIDGFVAGAIAEDSSITKVRVDERDASGFLIRYASDPSLVGTYEQSTESFETFPHMVTSGATINPTIVDGVRVWQVFSDVSVGEREFIVFSEHSFAFVDSIMLARRQNAYLGLTAIFLFLIALAYWLHRQTFWQQHSAALSEKLHERDLFSNMIAHEFRTPLTAIKGYASFLEESTNLSADEHRFVTNIHTSSERLVLLVNDFLEVSRLQSGKLKINKQPVEVEEVVRKVLEDLTPLASEKHLVLLSEPYPEPIRVETDPDRLIQVLTNIITNSIKYTDQGEIRVVLRDDRAGVTIRVQDTGTGISAEDQQKLFTPFTRVGGVDNTATTGTGLGMWITKQLISLLGGTVGVESIKGVGTHVVINFKEW